MMDQADQDLLKPAYGRNTLDPMTIRRVLLIAPIATGDIIMILPMLTTLKNQLPHCKVDVLIVDSQRALLQHHPMIHQLFSFGSQWRKKGLLRSLFPRIKLLKQLATARYDLLLQPSDGSWGAALVCMLRIPYAAACGAKDHRSALKRYFWNQIFTHQVAARRQPMGPRHSVESNLDTLRQLGIFPTATDKNMLLEPGAETRTQVLAMLNELGLAVQQYIVIAPTASQSGKSMNPKVCRETLKALLGAGQRVILTGAPLAQELQYLAQVSEGLTPAPINLGGKLNLMQLCALISYAKCFLGVDSGAMHIAGASGTPVVAMYGPGNEHVSGPWTLQRRIVSTPMACRPCLQNGCGGSGVAECMAFIQPAQIITAIHALTHESQ